MWTIIAKGNSPKDLHFYKGVWYLITYQPDVQKDTSMIQLTQYELVRLALENLFNAHAEAQTEFSADCNCGHAVCTALRNAYDILEATL